MRKLYCPKCGAYLEGGDGECHDCRCGWQQPQDNPEWVDASFEPDWASAPGDTISNVMEENDWSLPYVKGLLDMDDLTLARLLAGSLEIDNDLAELLSHTIGSTPQFWLEREKQYRSAILRLDRNFELLNRI